MLKNPSKLTSQIAQLGTGLATRPRSVDQDIVLERRSAPRVRNLAVRLNSADMALLEDLTIWSRQHKLSAGWGTLLKVGLRLIAKDDQNLRMLQEAIKNDGRRRKVE